MGGNVDRNRHHLVYRIAITSTVLSCLFSTFARGFSPCRDNAHSVCSMYRREGKHMQQRGVTATKIRLLGKRDVDFRKGKVKTVLASTGDNGDADAALFRDLNKRIQELGLNDESGADTNTVEDGEVDEMSSTASATNDDMEYIYVGGERIYLPQRMTSRSNGQRNEMISTVRSDSIADSDNDVTSRRRLLDEARPTIVGSLEALALAVSLFFVATFIVTGGRLLTSASSITTTTTNSQARVILDPDELLRDDFNRDGMAVLYDQQLQQRRQH